MKISRRKAIQNSLIYASGSAAVQSVKTGQPANDLNTEQLITTLREWDANLPQDTLSRAMTRA
jgi:hypothetical protein